MNQGYKLAIVGSREWTNYQRFTAEMTKFVSLYGKPEVVISGGAEGIDKMAERWANDQKILLVVVKPDYRMYGKKAPLMRNSEIVDRCDWVLALPHPNSRGTWDSVRKAWQCNKKVTLVEWKTE